MTPAELNKYLAIYADGEVDPAFRRAVEEHLAAHPEDWEIVERWRALRRTVRRTIDSTPVPTGLGERLRAAIAAEAATDGAAAVSSTRTAASRRPHRRAWWMGLSGLAAAVMVAAFTLWPSDAAGNTVEVRQFADVYLTCAMLGCDKYELCNAPGCDCGSRLRKECGFDCRMADMSPCGRYKVGGGCPCASSAKVRIAHVFFRPEEPNAPVMSLFATERPVRVVQNGRASGKCNTTRAYQTAQYQRVAAVAWQEGERTYVLCAEVEPQRLVQMADAIKL